MFPARRRPPSLLVERSKKDWIGAASDRAGRKEGPRQCGERPWERTGFKIKGLKRHIHERRGDLLSAALTIVRAWYTSGQPKADVPTLGSFEEWAETIGSVMAFAGVDGFLGNLEQTQVVQDEDSQQWAAFFEAWWDAFGPEPVVVADLCKRLIEADVHDDGARAVPEALLVHVDVHGAHAVRCGSHSVVTSRGCPVASLMATSCYVQAAILTGKFGSGNLRG